MWYGTEIRVGRTVRRKDDPRHEAVVLAISGTAPGLPHGWTGGTKVALRWQNGWRGEELIDDLERA